MRRVVVLGRGGAGKSVLARRIGAPVIELDTAFRRLPDLRPLQAAEWWRRRSSAGRDVPPVTNDSPT